MVMILAKIIGQQALDIFSCQGHTNKGLQLLSALHSFHKLDSDYKLNWLIKHHCSSIERHEA